MKVADFMSSPIYTVSSEWSVKHVSDMMRELKVGSLVVVDHGRTVGIITSRDVRSSHPNRIVADAMTPNPITILPNLFAWDALKKMKEHHIERLLVAEGDKTMGLVTRETLQIRLSQICDPLTGLYRAPYIQQIGEQLLVERRGFQLLFIDLNNFGEINKMHGHPIGDDILAEFSSRLKELTHKQDYLSRYAGDEFVVITCHDEQDSMRIAASLSQLTVIQNVNVSASVGIVNCRLVPDFFSLTFRELISKASLISTSLKHSDITA